MASKHFWVRNKMYCVNQNLNTGGNELMLSARSADIGYPNYAKDKQITDFIFFTGKPEGRNFPSNVRVIYNTPKDEFQRLVELTDCDNSAYLCLEFERKSLTRVFAYSKDTGE